MLSNRSKNIQDSAKHNKGTRLDSIQDILQRNQSDYLLAIAKRQSSSLDWPEDVGFFGITHSVKNNRSQYGFIILSAVGQVLYYGEGGLPSLESVLLRTQTFLKIDCLSWMLYQPSQGVKLYRRPRTYADRLDRKVRRQFLDWLRWYQLSEELKYSTTFVKYLKRELNRTTAD